MVTLNRGGMVLHGLGNARGGQGRWEESFDLHCRALAQYQATIGANHYRTANLQVKVAEHHLRLGQPQEAE
jgi:hypothetical protein